MSYLFPDPAEQKIVLDYMAFQVQHPGQKVHWALLIQGLPGNGKSYLGYVLQRVLGDHNVKMVKSETLHENFTGWQKGTQFIVVEEVMARGRMELMNKLKPMITEPWASIREMYKPPYQQPNRFNFLFLTNHTDAVIIDRTDRRYCVLYSLAPPHPEGKKYYEALFNWTDVNAGSLLHYFQQRDLRQFNPKAHAPMTAGKKDLITESMPPLDQFIHERVEDMEWPFNVDLIRACDLVPVLPEFGLRNVTPQAVGKALRRLEYTDLGRKRCADGGDVKWRVWAVRNHDTYLKMNDSKLRQVFGQQPTLQPRQESGNPTDAEIISGRQNAVKASRPM